MIAKALTTGESAVRELLIMIGENPDRPGLLETPARVVKAYSEWFDGYDKKPEDILKTFEDGAELCGDEMVLVKDLDIKSCCEHHMAPFFGKAHIAYIPDKKIVGLSKLPRVADVFAHRLQVQERLTNQIANAIDEHLQPKGVAVMIEAVHFCMCSRGVNKQGSSTITSALRGAFLNEPSCRAEFYSLVKP